MIETFSPVDLTLERAGGAVWVQFQNLKGVWGGGLLPLGLGALFSRALLASQLPFQAKERSGRLTEDPEGRWLWQPHPLQERRAAAHTLLEIIRPEVD